MLVHVAGLRVNAPPKLDAIRTYYIRCGTHCPGRNSFGNRFFTHRCALIPTASQGAHEIEYLIVGASDVFVLPRACLRSCSVFPLQTKSWVYRSAVKFYLRYVRHGSWGSQMKEGSRSSSTNVIGASSVIVVLTMDELPTILLQRWLKLFGHAACPGEGKLIRDMWVSKPRPV